MWEDLTLSAQFVSISRCGGLLSRVDRLGAGDDSFAFVVDTGDFGA